jgi:hypothetical protein
MALGQFDLEVMFLHNEKKLDGYDEDGLPESSCI